MELRTELARMEVRTELPFEGRDQTIEISLQETSDWCFFYKGPEDP